MASFDKFLTKVFGSSNQRFLKSVQPIIAQINELEPALQKLSDDELRARTAVFKERVARSAYLSGISLVIAVIIALPLGIYQAVKRNTLGDNAATSAAFILYSMPSFFLGLILIQVFAISLPIFNFEAASFCPGDVVRGENRRKATSPVTRSAAKSWSFLLSETSFIPTRSGLAVT